MSIFLRPLLAVVVKNTFLFFALLFFIVLPSHDAQAAGEFITTWKTDNAGDSAANQISIPTNDGEGYNYDVDWGDESTSLGVTGDVTHTYAAPGTYQVSITGDFPGMFFVLGGDREKLLSIDQWGDPVWISLSGSFFGCTNLTIEATDAPDLSAANDMTYAFRSSGLTTEDLSGWDVSTIVTAIGVFQDTAFNGDVTTWNVSNMITPSALFYNDPVFNQDISSWDLGSATTLNAMFYGNTAFNQDIGSWDVSQVTDMAELFFGATAFDQDLSAWQVGNVTTMVDMFDGVQLSNENYSNILTSWSEQDVQAGVTFDAGDSTYCAVDARAVLTDAPTSWTIADGGNICLTAVTPIEETTTIDEAIYYFAASEALDEALELEEGSYLSEAPTCADCEVLIDSVAHTLSFSGLQVGDVLDFSFTFTGANLLQIGPSTVVAEPSSSSRGSRRAKTSFHPPGEDEDEAEEQVSSTGVSPYDGSLEDITPVEAGSYIRGEHYDTVYFVTDDFERRPLYDAQTFFTWQDSFEHIVWVTDATLSTLPLGDPLLPRAGTVLVKLVSDPSVYTITESQMLRQIPTEEVAAELYGSEWADYVIDLSPTLFPYFSEGDVLEVGEQIDTSLLKTREELASAV